MKTSYLLLFIFLQLHVVAQKDSASHYYQTGQEALQEKKFRVSELAFNRSIEFDQNYLPSLKGLYQTLKAQSRYPEAYAVLLKIAPLTPTTDEMVIGELADMSLSLRRWQDAINYGEKAIQLNLPGNHAFAVSKAYYNLEDYGKALKYADQAWRKDSSNAEIAYIAARSFLEMSNYKKAAGCYEQALAADPTKVIWMYEAGLVYYAIPNDKKAIYWIEKAGENGYAKSADYYENLANAYINDKQFEKGNEILVQLVSKRPYDTELLYNVADGYYKQTKYDLAIEYWDKVLALDKENAQALYMIGLSYQKKGDVQKGQQLCDAAIKLDPSLESLKKERKIR